MISYFKSPVYNTTPLKEVTLLEIYNTIKSNEFLNITNSLRVIKDKKSATIYKNKFFDFVTFSGVFSERLNTYLIKHSGLITIDIDNISNVEETKNLLLNDEYFETELLFISPSGNGLKWIVTIDLIKADHVSYFQGIKNYLFLTYDINIDPSGKDIARACFVPHDVNCYINPKHLKND
jgi:hypothetical protein